MAEPWTYAFQIIRSALVSVKNQKHEALPIRNIPNREGGWFLGAPGNYQVREFSWRNCATVVVWAFRPPSTVMT